MTCQKVIWPNNNKKGVPSKSFRCSITFGELGAQIQMSLLFFQAGSDESSLRPMFQQ